MVAGPAPDGDDRLSGPGAEPGRADGLRRHPARDARGLQPGLAVPHHPALPAGQGRTRAGGARPARADRGRPGAASVATGHRGDPMTDAGYVVAAYGVIVGGLVLYTVSLWRRLRAVQHPDDGGR